MPRSTPVRAGLLVLVGAALAGGCKRSRAEASGDPGALATVRAGELSTEGRPGTRPAIETVEVPGDRAVLFVAGEDTRRPIVHLHGMCSEPRSDLEAWSSGVSAHGTILALFGDTPCPGRSGTATWTTDVAAIDARIDAAIDAARARGQSLDANETILIGESLGAARAEALAARFPAKYTRVVLVGAPDTPDPKNLRDAKAVALVAGEKEPQAKMRKGSADLSSSGIAARFWEMPGATHGKYGPEGDRVMGEAVGFVAAR